MKRLLSFILSVLMIYSVFSSLGITANSAEIINQSVSYSSGDFVYDVLDDGTASITLYKGKEEKLTVPESIDGYIVSEIHTDCFLGNEKLTSVTLPDSIEFIWRNAFKNCTKLLEINLPNKVLKIYSNAFENTAYYNNSENWVDGVLYIGNHLIVADDTVSGEYTIKEGTLDIAEVAFYFNMQLTNVIIPDSVKRIGLSAFGYCQNIEDIDLHDGIESIGQDAFACIGYYNNNENWDNGILYIDNHLVSVGMATGDCVIREGTITIADAAFSYSSIDSIVMPDSVKFIGNSTFNECISLGIVQLSANITELEDSVFYKCGNLSSVTMPEKLTSIGHHAFANCFNLSEITIPEGVVKIGKLAFSYCQRLTKVEMPDSVTEIGANAFAHCTNLAELKLSNNLKKINFNTFYNCTELKSLTIPDSVEIIGDSAFNSCSGLTDLKIGQGVKTIGEYAFEACTGLESLIIPDNVINIENHAFACCQGVKTITLGSGIENLGICAFTRCSSLTKINFPEQDIKNMGYGIFSYCTALTDITVGNGITKVADSMFRDCTALTTVVMGDSVENIEYLAFGYCSNLSNVTLGKNVAVIGNAAFGTCKNLTNITIPASVTRIESGAFAGCSNLTDVTILNPYYKDVDSCIYNNAKIIKGHEKSKAESYANKNSIEFISIGTYSCTDYNRKHTEITSKAKDATYFEKGYTSETVCTVCNTVIAKKKAVPKLKLATPTVKLTAGKKKFKVKYTKVTNATGFEVKYKLGKKIDSKTFNKNKKVTKTIKKLTVGNYKVQVRAFKKSGTKIAYSKWTKVEKVKVK